MNKYIFYIDIDGTLVKDFDLRLDENLIKKITELQNDGHIFVIITGRAIHSAMLIHGIEKFDFISASFNNFVYDLKNNEILFKGNMFSKEQIDNLLSVFIRSGGLWSYKNEYNDRTIYKELKDAYPSYDLVTFDDFFSDIDSGIYHFMYYDYFDTNTKKLVVKDISLYEMPGRYTDIVLKTASKDKIVDYFKSKLNDYISVGIGDSSNDIPLLNKVDISIAMGNANEEVKKLTNYTTLDVEDNGVLYAINNILKL